MVLIKVIILVSLFFFQISTIFLYSNTLSLIEMNSVIGTNKKPVFTKKRSLPEHLRLKLERQKQKLDLMQFKLTKDIEQLDFISKAE